MRSKPSLRPLGLASSMDFLPKDFFSCKKVTATEQPDYKLPVAVGSKKGCSKRKICASVLRSLTGSESFHSIGNPPTKAVSHPTPDPLIAANGVQQNILPINYQVLADACEIQPLRYSVTHVCLCSGNAEPLRGKRCQVSLVYLLLRKSLRVVIRNTTQSNNKVLLSATTIRNTTRESF